MFGKIAPSSNNLEKSLTLDEIINYLYKCDTVTYKEVNPQTEKPFMPYSIAAAIITNKNYDPENFSEDIELSEQDHILDELEYMAKDPFHEYTYHNTEKWKNNHVKKAPLTAIFGPMLQSSQIMTTKEWEENGTEYTLTETRRTFGNVNNINKITKWYNDLKQKCINIYDFSI